MELVRAEGHLWGIATTAGYQGLLACAEGRYPEAAALHRESLELRVLIGVKEDLAGCLADVATLAVARDRADVAARLFGAAEALRATIGAPAKLPERTTYEAAAERARGQLGDAAYEAERLAGRALSLEDAIALARRATEVEEAASQTAGATSLGGERLLNSADAALLARLTPRELEVLRLLAAGRSTPELAATLSISPRTATTHVANLLGKLGVDSRAAAVALAYRIGLV
jgi:non-specific serine/threonine protein kinase